MDSAGRRPLAVQPVRASGYDAGLVTLVRSTRAEGGIMRHDGPVKPFVDDDSGYLRWLAEHPDQFVLNTDRVPKPGYLILHRATCRTISVHTSRGSRWTADFQKVCGSQDELERYARHTVGGQPRRCPFCQ